MTDTTINGLADLNRLRTAPDLDGQSQTSAGLDRPCRPPTGSPWG